MEEGSSYKNCCLMTTKPNQALLSAEDIKNINNLFTRHPLVLVEGRSLMTQQSSVALINFLSILEVPATFIAQVLVFT